MNINELKIQLRLEKDRINSKELSRKDIIEIGGKKYLVELYHEKEKTDK